MKILVAYDGSKVSKQAAQLALAHAKAFQADILLVFSIVGGPEIPRKEFEDAERALQGELPFVDQDLAQEFFVILHISPKMTPVRKQTS